MRRIFNDVATLAARIGVGGIFFANGWDKLEAGLNATTAQFAQQGAPAPNVWAALAMLIELLGGALLIAGFAVPICGILLFVEALAVFIVASGDPGQPLTGGDTNLIVALGSASVLLAVVGPGRVSVDHMVVIKRRDNGDPPAATDPDAEADAMLAALRDPKSAQAGSTDAAPAPASGAASGGSAAAGAAAASGTKSGTASKSTARRTRDAEEKGASAARSESDDSPESAPKTRKSRQRRTDPGSESTTASRSEAPAATEKAEKGDKLVAGRQENAAD